MATPTSKLEEFLNPEQFAEDMNLLKQFRFEQGDLVIHTDATVMPPRRKDWSVLSYMMDRKFTRQQFTVWMNAVEPSLVGKNPVFQTWRPVVDIDPKSHFKSDLNACSCRLANYCFKQRATTTSLRTKP